jgi:hypothetical protein
LSFGNKKYITADMMIAQNAGLEVSLLTIVLELFSGARAGWHRRRCCKSR